MNQGMFSSGGIEAYVRADFAGTPRPLLFIFIADFFSKMKRVPLA